MAETHFHERKTISVYDGGNTNVINQQQFISSLLEWDLTFYANFQLFFSNFGPKRFANSK